jgi:CRP-like cAMP-binding protein
MLTLEKLLSHRIHSLKKFTLEQRVKLCHKIRYARYPQGKVVIKEGHKALSFYIVLSGKVDIFKMLPDRVMRLNVSQI